MNEEDVLKLNDPGECYFYCKHNQLTANITAHQKIIINSKNFFCCYLFARDIKRADRQLLSEVILSSYDSILIKRYYKNIKFDKTRYEELILFI